MLGPWEIVIIGLALAVLFGVPVLAMVLVMHVMRWRRGRRRKREQAKSRPPASAR
jgi:Sec-independent protein translocase protein TatA